MISRYTSKAVRKISGALLPHPYQDHILRGLLYVHIPKCGGNSIVDAIGFDRKHHVHAEYYHYERANKKRFNTCHKFTVTRNPVDRAYSLYRYMKKGGNGGEHDRRISEEHFQESEDFNGFILNQLTPEWVSSWVMLRPQAAFIYNQNNELMVDTVLRLENLGEDFAEMLRMIGKKARALPHLNSSGSSQAPVRVTAEAMEKLQLFYQRDFKYLYPQFDPETRIFSDRA